MTLFESSCRSEISVETCVLLRCFFILRLRRLYVMTREKVVEESKIQKMLEVVEKNGFDLSQVATVPHKQD